MPASPVEVKAHRRVGERGARSTSGSARPAPIAPGDAFTVTAGCDKRLATCRDTLRQRRELPRLPAHARQRLRHPRARGRASRASTAGACSGERVRGAPSGALVAEARSWIGTPYRHQASLKGVGCDCLGLLRGVWRALIGPEPEEAPPYAPDWAEASAAGAPASRSPSGGLVRAPSGADPARRRPAVPLARRPAGQALRHRQRRPRRWSTPMTARASRRWRSRPGGGGISPGCSRFPGVGE